MKALILAAGLGTRLEPLTNEMPKSLVPVNGKPILHKQIEDLLASGVTDITIISGYKADVLRENVLKRWPDINIIESVDYASTNNMYSAYLGIKEMFPDGDPGPFLMMNADVFFDESVIKALLSDEYPNSVVVDTGRYLEESMKVIEEDGRLREISKTITEEDALGSSIDVYRFSSEGAEAFFGCCKDYIENKKELKLWSEVALNDAFGAACFTACPLSGRWLEIDNLEDLSEAEALFSD